MDYADRKQLDSDMADVFLEVVRKLDSMWLEWQAAQRSKR